MDTTDKSRPQIEEGEISLRELILQLKAMFQEVLNHWKWVVLITLLGGALLFLKAHFSTKTYPAKLTFMINQEDGNSLGGINAILGQFGLGGGGKGKFNLDKVLELSKSRRIIQKALFKKESIVEGKGNDFLANAIIHLYDFHEEWEDDTTGLKQFVFEHDHFDRFDRTQNRALKQIYKKVVGGEKTKGIYGTKYDDDTGIMSLTTESVNEALSLKLTHWIFEELSRFYIEKSVEKQQQTFDVVQSKVDSIYGLLSGKEYALANYRDSNLGIWTKKDALKEQQLRRDIQVLNLMYGEALKNLEIADFTLKNKTPFVQLIDRPIAPIKANKDSRLRGLILGGFLGGFFAVVWLIGRRTLRNIMQE
ncbi:MAG: hypothetical protein AAF985_03735 [Bacteroidota bacterium]